MNKIAIARHFHQQGYIIIPKMFSLFQIVRLKIICDRILNCWIRKSFAHKNKPDKKTLSLLTKPEYFDRYIEQLEFLLKAIADERILSILQCICDVELLFNSAAYYFNPIASSWRGDWHRDGQIIMPDDDTEKDRIFNSSLFGFILL